MPPEERQARVAAVTASLVLPPHTALRGWTEADGPAIAQLARAERWTTQDAYPDEFHIAWQQSWPVLVATVETTGEIVGFLRAITDGAVTVYIAELIVAPAFRGTGLGATLVEACHLLVPTARLDLLSLPDATGFYERIGFRAFRGYRKSFR